ncbi:MAG: transcriptional regulator [Actinomycetota bacterium]
MVYAQRVGERLRNVRLQKGLSLHDVETASSKEFKASVLGAYERGERSISVPRLQRLARFYAVPVDHLLPRDADEEPLLELPRAGTPEKIRIDLQRLSQVDGGQAPEKAVLERYCNMVQMQRRDFNGRVLTIRHEDLRALASVLDLSPESLSSKIDTLGLRAPVLA